MLLQGEGKKKKKRNPTDQSAKGGVPLCGPYDFFVCGAAFSLEKFNHTACWKEGQTCEFREVNHTPESETIICSFLLGLYHTRCPRERTEPTMTQCFKMLRNIISPALL